MNDSLTQSQSTDKQDDEFLVLLAERLRSQGESLLQTAFLINSQGKALVTLAEAIEQQLREEEQSSPLVQLTRTKNEQ